MKTPRLLPPDQDVGWTPIAYLIYLGIKSWRSGKEAGPNPWKANTLEWTTPSPPPHGNWPPDQMPNVYRGAYEYQHPDREEDYWPQHLPG